ncbi:MAG: YlxR family protein [Anaerolineales bacterium]
MSNKKSPKTKHIPQRTCVGCREVLAKRILTRVVRLPDGEIAIDPTGKCAGRGAYVHNQRSCWQKALKGALANALKTSLSPENLQNLQVFVNALPEEEQA